MVRWHVDQLFSRQEQDVPFLLLNSTCEEECVVPPPLSSRQPQDTGSMQVDDEVLPMGEHDKEGVNQVGCHLKCCTDLKETGDHQPIWRTFWSKAQVKVTKVLWFCSIIVVINLFDTFLSILGETERLKVFEFLYISCCYKKKMERKKEDKGKC